MIRVSRKEFEDFKRHREPEVFTEKQINNWILSHQDTIQKAELTELDKVEKAEVQRFNDEFSSFMKVEVVGTSADLLTKGLQYDVFYIRESQIDWDPIEKAEESDDKDKVSKKEADYTADWKTEETECEKCKAFMDGLCKKVEGKISAEGHCKFFTAKTSEKSIENDIQKSRSGTYKDTALNRKMGRVGQRFGSEKKEDINKSESNQLSKKSEKKIDKFDRKTNPNLWSFEKSEDGKKIWTRKVDDELEKGAKGEGSKGGKIVGHTKSGTPIYENKNFYSKTREIENQARKKKGIHSKAKEDESKLKKDKQGKKSFWRSEKDDLKK